MSYAEHKQRVAEIVDATYAATLDGVPARLGGRQPAIPCRAGGGAGGATGDYEPSGDIELPLAEIADPRALAQRIRRYWEQEGFEITSIRPNLTVLANDGEYQVSFRVYPKSDIAALGASGPCATPESDAEREAPVEFESVAGKQGSG